MEYTVKVSYMEIYMEKIRDLLNRKLVYESNEDGGNRKIVSLSHLLTPFFSIACSTLLLSQHSWG